MAKTGRPKKDTRALTVRMETRWLKIIDDMRRQEPDLPTAPEMVRRMLAREFERQELIQAD